MNGPSSSPSRRAGASAGADADADAGASAAPRATASEEGRIRLSSIRRMFEGIIPGVLCTISADGVPHVCFMSQAEYMDEEHIAISFQFFNRSRENILATRRAALTIDDPYTAAGVRLKLEYLRTETSGPLFERMKAKLAGIASHSGMDKVFKLQGSDIYRVVDARAIEHHRELRAPAPRCDLASASRAMSDRLAACTDTGSLLDETMASLHEHLGIDHAMLMMLDPATQRLYTVASRGYDASGIGAEIELGHGVAGVAAREGVPIRCGHMSLWHVYGQAIRRRAADYGLSSLQEAEEIPMPGLAEPRSQMAVPLRLFGKAVGVLLLESMHDQHFSYDDEDALTVLCAQLALQMHVLQSTATEAVAPPRAPAVRTPAGEAIVIRHHPYNDSIFIGNDYLIKGVAGAIFRKLVADHLETGRIDFTNRELRLDPSLRLPDVTDNLEVRLLLLQRRLQERSSPVRLEKTGRGRIRLQSARPLQLHSVDA